VAERRQAVKPTGSWIAQRLQAFSDGWQHVVSGSRAHDLPSRPRARRFCYFVSALDRLCGRGRVAPGPPWSSLNAPQSTLPRGVDAADGCPASAHGRYADMASLQNGTRSSPRRACWRSARAHRSCASTGRTVVSVVEGVAVRHRDDANPWAARPSAWCDLYAFFKFGLGYRLFQFVALMPGLRCRSRGRQAYRPRPMPVLTPPTRLFQSAGRIFTAASALLLRARFISAGFAGAVGAVRLDEPGRHRDVAAAVPPSTAQRALMISCGQND